MKWICLLLLVANIAYFGWTLDQRTRENVQAQAGGLQINSEDAPRLKLISELEQAPVKRMQVNDGQPGETAPDSAPDLVATLPDISTTLPESLIVPMRLQTDACFSFGPFADAGRAGELRSWLSEQGARVKLRREADSSERLFWVYLAPDDGAEAVMRELRESGIRDISMIDTGDLQNAISLGLFSSQASVNRRLNELRDKGYQPVAVPYDEGRTIYWVDTRLVHSETIQALRQNYPAGLNYLPKQCDKIALSASKP